VKDSSASRCLSQIRSCWLPIPIFGSIFVTIVLLLSLPIPAAAATIQGKVLDSAGRPVSGASIRLELKGDPGVSQTVLQIKTSSAGAFTFSAVSAGTYSLIAEQAGRRSRSAIVTASGNPQELVLVLDEGSAAPDAFSPQAMEFADKPNFTVAGVTDWTAVGGHGSDSTLRTSEDLARETLTLKAQGSAGGTGKTDAHKDDADVHRRRGELDEKMGDPLAAVHEEEQAVRLDPSEQNFFTWGSELLLHRAVWQAAEVFRNGTATYPKSARMLAALGTALFAGARYDEAAANLCQASDLNPADPEPYIFMGKVELAAPKPLPCIEPRLARFVRQHPENALANYFYAMAILKRQQEAPHQQDRQKVESLLRKAVAVDPKCGDAYLQLGILSVSQHNLDQAIAYYTKAIEADPQMGEAHYRLGVAYDRVGAAERAKREFQLHDEIERLEAAAVEQQRREVKQFLVVLGGQPNQPPAH
jgi:tetratricopeptide (TPR) repeat protein